MSDAIDPYGLMTKAGRVKDLGAIGLYDFQLISKLNNHLSREEVKSLLYVKERAHIGARYHQAVFYEYVPRLWAINMGKDERGNDDPTEWFANEHLEGIVRMLKGDLEGLKRLSEHDKAIARRIVVFVVEDDLFDEKEQGATDAAAIAFWEQGMANATPLD